MPHLYHFDVFGQKRSKTQSNSAGNGGQNRSGKLPREIKVSPSRTALHTVPPFLR